MAALTGITTVKQFTYRGDPTEQFSNTYHFRSAPPSTSEDWDTMFHNLANIEKGVFPTTTHIVAAYGYDNDDEKPVSVWSTFLAIGNDAISGTYSPTPGEPEFAGDQASLVSWQLDERDRRGKYKYCRKYLHNGYSQVTTPDHLSPTYKSALLVYAAALDPSGGAFHGGIRARTTAAPVNYHAASDWVTTRTLKRRGKRPLAHA